MISKYLTIHHVRMAAFYNPDDLETLVNWNLIIDTNILITCSTDPAFLYEFHQVFHQSKRLVDPIARLEFLRNTPTDSLYSKKLDFLKLNEFYEMTDRHELYFQTKTDAELISRVYSHHRKPNVPLGDLFITAKIKNHCSTHLFVTLDQQDFTTLLFDRITSVAIESMPSKNEFHGTSLYHVILLKFNNDKYSKCLSKLKN